MTYEKYALYVGDTIPTISLWVRRNDNELATIGYRVVHGYNEQTGDYLIK